MKFQFDGKTYKLSFTRNRRQLDLQRSGKVKQVLSKFPYTTATLRVVAEGSAPELVGSAVVGCAPFDKYSHEAGRRFALRALTARLRKMAVAIAKGKGAEGSEGYQETIEKYQRFAALIWETYLNRLDTDKEPNDPPQSVPAALLLGEVVEQAQVTVH